ncbi:MAG: hypothetical protein A2Y54_01720 [Chloroflexi bacterium RBG_16_51_16]|nr:MAG: hypothetical protein A2Y54_01720 [Chloroflexi bacterium RBG_16_51_16]
MNFFLIHEDVPYRPMDASWISSFSQLFQADGRTSSWFWTALLIWNFLYYAVVRANNKPKADGL